MYDGSYGDEPVQMKEVSLGVVSTLLYRECPFGRLLNARVGMLIARMIVEWIIVSMLVLYKTSSDVPICFRDFLFFSVVSFPETV